MKYESKSIMEHKCLDLFQNTIPQAEAQQFRFKKRCHTHVLQMIDFK